MKHEKQFDYEKWRLREWKKQWMAQAKLERGMKIPGGQTQPYRA